MLKNFIYLLTLTLLFSCGVPYQISSVKLKDGSTKTLLVKQDEGFLLTKDNFSDSPEKLHYSEIDYVKKKNNLNEETKFKFFKVAGKNQYLLLEEEIVGPVSLYIQTTEGTNTEYATGMTYNYTSIGYYVKKEHNNEVIFLTSDSALNFKFTEIGQTFFRDCPELVQKIEDKDFRKKDVYEVVKFYNKNCAVGVSLAN
ncbi:hypothetical protein [Flavobacteriaceae bacterium 14752]|uniref:hypothetical protein n=1 Tax=Mesohalobacter salilacus TaxID=2491711 RepID=UPI000F63393C|nr:hypothetical protein EIG84_07520 [Flavobacteriaceae bacterium 14752]